MDRYPHYVGKGAADLLRLGRGDILLCSLTLENSRAGSVVPSELRRLARRGVRLYTRADLHAKVFLLGSRAIVGSANFSKHSRDCLDEAGVLVTARAEVTAIREWFAMRFAEPVESEWLATCEKAYRAAERRRAPPQHRVPEARTVVAGPWVISTAPDPSDDAREQRQRDTIEKEGQARVANRRSSSVETLKWTDDDWFRERARVGDVVVEFHRERGTQRVQPHARILARREGKAASGETATYFALEFPKLYRTVARKYLDEELRRQRLRLRRWEGRVVDRDLSLTLLRFTSPDRLRR